MKIAMLTTVDNPFDPFTQFDEWYVYDSQLGYYSTAYLARVVNTSNDMSDADQRLAVSDGIDEIVSTDPTGKFIKVTKEV